MHPAAPPYRIRHLDGRAEYEMLGAQVMAWRRRRNLPAESARPILEALRDEREMAVLVDTHNNAFVACLQLDRTALATPSWTDFGNTQPTLGISCAATAPGAEYRLDWLLTIWARHYAALCGYSRVACAVPLRHDHAGKGLINHLMNEWGWDRLGATSSPGGAVVLLTADTCRADGLDALIATEVPVLPAASAKKEAASWTKLP
ncbi:predicted protein [Streptomyces viridosporus ATCC 14672]|uniref:Predicted protein n=1 Tax=Streptomyces viridosporus (strain ATCC 14672 / DSM 40746 / JCM 4963 / KCTC 9882 / NRRL B-12104 / FH 1290) TaxID=566461 RepID=D5ZQ79_STRV1|nr:hypothetical protein [Streptomyces viridosporus]EFE72321.1 predicted protein [Streptomyces viridosporus ATCC 14672]